MNDDQPTSDQSDTTPRESATPHSAEPNAVPEDLSKGETADPQPPTDSGWAKAYELPSDMDPMFSMYL